MSTVLELINTSKPYTFKSLGIINKVNKTYTESTLFPINSNVTINEGKFPLFNFKDLDKIYSIGNDEIGYKEVILDSFDRACEQDVLNKVGKCTIEVIASSASGGSRSKSRRSHKNKRSKRSNRSNRSNKNKSKKRNSKH